MKNIIIKNIFIIVIAAVAIVLRLYKVQELFYFSYDEAIPAFVGRNLLLFGKLPLIGGVTPFGVHITPYFYWLLAFVISIGNLDPIWWGFASALFSTFTVLLIYFVGRKIFNKNVGTYSAIIWTFSFLANVYDRHFWALFWGPMLCLATNFALYKIIHQDKKYVWLLMGVFVWSISTDPSNLVFIFLSVLVYAIYRIKIMRIEVIALIVILVSLSPLLAFDLRHNFANSKPILKYLRSEKTESRFENQNLIDRTNIFTNSLIRIIYPFSDDEIAKNYSYCPSYITEKYERVPYQFKVLAFIAFSLFAYLALKRKNLGMQLLSLTLIVYFLGIQAYGIIFNGDIFEHYISGLFPIFVLIIAFYLASIPKKLAITLLAVFIGVNLITLVKANNSHGLKYKKLALEYVYSKLQNKPFSLESLSTCWRYSGYRYLFAAYGLEPVKSYVDPNLAHLYGSTPVSEEHPDTVVAIITHDFNNEIDDFYKKYAKYKSHQTSNSIFGNIEVIIMDNRGKWF